MNNTLKIPTTFGSTVMSLTYSEGKLNLNKQNPAQRKVHISFMHLVYVNSTVER